MKVTSVLRWAALCAASAAAQDISGRVVDKLLAPVPGAKVCVQGSPAHCALAGADGAFRLTAGSTALPAFRTLGFRLEARAGIPTLHAPRDQVFTLEWLDASGRRLSGALSVPLRAGANPLRLPAEARAGSLVILKATTPGLSLAWKGLLGSGPEGRAGISVVGTAGPLAKAGDAPILEATKAGYGVRTYAPVKEVETGVEIMLPAAGEAALFDGRTLNGWKGTPGWWSVVDGAIRGKGTSNGLLVTDGDYSEFRLFLRSRNVNGRSHMGICFWGRRDPNYKYGECTLVMPHDGGQWDYHSGEGGVPHQSPPPKASGAQVPDQSKFYYTEVLVSRARKTIQMESNGVWMVNHRNKEGLTLWHGPIGLQIHDGSIELEHKDIFVEVDPKEPEKLLYLK